MFKRGVILVFTVFTVTIVALTGWSMFRPVEFDLSRFDRISPSRMPTCSTELDTIDPTPKSWQVANLESGIATVFISNSSASPTVLLEASRSIGFQAFADLYLERIAYEGSVSALAQDTAAWHLRVQWSRPDDSEYAQLVEERRIENLESLDHVRQSMRNVVRAGLQSLADRRYYLDMAASPASQVVLRFPLWHFAVPLALVNAFVLLRGPLRRRRRRKRGLCLNCGYDLTGNISGRCPECGKTVVHDSAYNAGNPQGEKSEPPLKE